MFTVEKITWTKGGKNTVQESYAKYDQACEVARKDEKVINESYYPNATIIAAEPKRGEFARVIAIIKDN